MEKEKLQAYWKSNLRYLIILSSLGFFFGLVCPFLLVDQLNTIQLGGIPLGFWFAAQGGFIAIVILLFVYVWLMNRLDKKYGMEDK